MLRRTVLAYPILSAALGLAGCQPGMMLELDVLNESQDGAIIEVLGPDGVDAGFREAIGPSGGRELSMERPGPGGWSVVVNGQVATDSEEWPDDNPTIDLTIVIESDGSVVVEDT